LKNYPILRILLAAVMIYFAWPLIPLASTALELTFWGLWLFFFLLIIGANLANLLQMIPPPVIEQEYKKVKQSVNR